MEIARFDTELLYQVSLPAGVGSNPIGLDRGQTGRLGGRRLRARRPEGADDRSRTTATARSRSDAAERRAVEESFARSVLWGFKVEAAEGERVLVDATAFFLRDAHGVIDRLRQAKQGTLQLDDSRAALLPAAHEGLPEEHRGRDDAHLHDRRRPGPARARGDAGAGGGHACASITRSSSCRPRRQLQAAAARPAGRRRSASTFHDYASPITEPIEKRWIARHRLREEGPGGRGLRAGRADRLLRGQRRARADPQRAGRGRVVVERRRSRRPASATRSR